MAETGGLSVSSRVRAGLRCPKCYSVLRTEGLYLVCHGTCGIHFPIVDQVPILIDETTSIFNVKDFVDRQPTFFPPRSSWHRGAVNRIPELGRNFSSLRNFGRFADLLTKSVENPLVL